MYLPQMRRTGKYYVLNLTLAALPIASSVLLATIVDKEASWTDWVLVIPTAVGTGGNVS